MPKNQSILKEIGLCIQTMITIMDSIVNIIGGENLHDHLINERENLDFDNEQDIHLKSKNYDLKSGLWPWFGFASANLLVLISCFISYEKWASRKE